MRAVIQRVLEAQVSVDGVRVAAIQRGFLILLGVQDGDTETDLEWLVGKVSRLRVFVDDAGKMNRGLVDIAGEALVVSQFTLMASCANGNRPDFMRAAKPDEAKRLYERFASRLGELISKPVPTGIFGADMRVGLVNDGPVTIIIDSRLRE